MAYVDFTNDQGNKCSLPLQWDATLCIIGWDIQKLSMTYFYLIPYNVWKGDRKCLHLIMLCWYGGTCIFSPTAYTVYVYMYMFKWFALVQLLMVICTHFKYVHETLLNRKCELLSVYDIVILTHAHADMHTFQGEREGGQGEQEAVR